MNGDFKINVIIKLHSKNLIKNLVTFSSVLKVSGIYHT